MRIIRELTYIGPRGPLLTGWNRRAVTGTRSFGISGTITERVKYYAEDDDASEPPPLTDEDIDRLGAIATDTSID